MYFPISGVETNPAVPFLVAFVISFFTSMGGVSGAFLLLPFQVSVLGYTAPSVSATNQVYNIVSIPSGVYRYIREGRMLWPLTVAVIAGTLPGVFIGAWVRIEYLPDPRFFKLFAGLVLLYIGGRMLQDVFRKKINVFAKKKNRKASGNTDGSDSDHVIRVTHSSLKTVTFDYDSESFQFSPAKVYLLCFLVGIAGGIYGVGGGAIVAPFFVTIVGLPVYAVAGAALSGTFVTSVAGAVFFQFLARFYPDMSIAPDWQLGILFGIGGLFGMYLGARTQKFVPARIIKGILCVCALFVAIKYILGAFL